MSENVAVEAVECVECVEGNVLTVRNSLLPLCLGGKVERSVRCCSVWCASHR